MAEHTVEVKTPALEVGKVLDVVFQRRPSRRSNLWQVEDIERRR